MVLVCETVRHGRQDRSGLQSSLHQFATGTGDLIAASVELSSRRRETQALRDIMLITLVRCCSELSPQDILAVAGEL